MPQTVRLILSLVVGAILGYATFVAARCAIFWDYLGAKPYLPDGHRPIVWSIAGVICGLAIELIRRRFTSQPDGNRPGKLRAFVIFGLAVFGTFGVLGGTQLINQSDYLSNDWYDAGLLAYFAAFFIAYCVPSGPPPNPSAKRYTAG
jgi:hypothetical protein